MKKILYVALAALVLMACNPNDPKMDKKDFKMLKEASANLLNQLGEKEKTVVSNLEKLGFFDTSEYAIGELPQRLGKPAAALDGDEANVFFYIGNKYREDFIAAAEKGKTTKMMSIMEDALEDKGIVIMATFTLNEDGKCNMIGGESFVSAELPNIHNLYLTCSKNIFLSLDEDKEWQGGLMEAEDAIAGEENEQTYTKASKRDKFEEDFAELEYPFAMESGADKHNKLVRLYNLQYIGNAEGTEMAPPFDMTLAGAMFQAKLDER